MNKSSDNLSFLVLPSVLGLVAGLAYGMAAHYANLPLSLTEHFAQSVQFPYHSQY